MPYFATLDNNFFECLSYNTGISSISNKALSQFPPSFIQYITSLEHNSTYSNDALLSTSYRYVQSISSLNPTVYTVNYTVKNSSDFFNYLNSNISFNIKNTNTQEIYPIAVRYTNGKNLWVIERPPFQTTITYRPTSSSSSSDKYKKYTMWMPWTVMVLNIDFSSSSYESFLYLNDGPINSLEDHLIPCFFPNIYSDGRMCLNQTSIGLQQYLAQTNSFDISTVYNYIINDYMSGGWNLDLGSGNFDTYVTHSSSRDSVLIKKLNRIMTHGDSNLKIKPLNSRYMGPSYKRKLAVAFTYFSSLTPEEIVSLVTESKNSNKEFTLNKIIKRAHSANNSNFDFYSLFHGFTRSVTPSITRDYPLIIPVSVRNSLNPSSSLNMFDESNKKHKEFSDNLLAFISSHLQQDKDNLTNSSEYYNTSILDSSPYIYAHSMKDFSFIASDDTSFNYQMETLNV